MPAELGKFEAGVGNTVVQVPLPVPYSSAGRAQAPVSDMKYQDTGIKNSYGKLSSHI